MNPIIGRIQIQIDARLAVCFALLGSGPYLINYLNSIGQQIAAGNESIGESALARFYRTQRESFDRSYIKFSDGLFTVKVNGQDMPVKPGLGGAEAVVGVLDDKESSIKDWEMISRFIPGTRRRCR